MLPVSANLGFMWPDSAAAHIHSWHESTVDISTSLARDRILETVAESEFARRSSSMLLCGVKWNQLSKLRLLGVTVR